MFVSIELESENWQMISEKARSLYPINTRPFMHTSIAAFNIGLLDGAIFLDDIY